MTLTRQQCADGIYTHFVVNKSPFAYSNEHSLCRYRTETGAKCAVGCLIPDEKYDSSLEQRNIINLHNNKHSTVLDMFNVLDLGFLSDCQDWHDDIARNLFPSETATDKDFLALKSIFVENGIDISNMPLLPQ